MVAILMTRGKLQSNQLRGIWGPTILRGRAFIWNTSAATNAPVPTESQLVPLLFIEGDVATSPVLPGNTRTVPNAINNETMAHEVQVVRDAQFYDAAGVFSSRAFIWDAANGIVDLNTLVTLSSGVILTNAYDISDTGYILCRWTNTITGQGGNCVLAPIA